MFKKKPINLFNRLNKELFQLRSQYIIWQNYELDANQKNMPNQDKLINARLKLQLLYIGTSNCKG